MRKIVHIALALGIFIVSRPIFAGEVPPTIQTQEKETLAGEPSGPEPRAEGKAEQKAPQTIGKRVVISEDGTITIYYEASDEVQSTPPPTSEKSREKNDGNNEKLEKMLENNKELEEILGHFHNVWYSRETGRNELTEEELEEIISHHNDANILLEFYDYYLLTTEDAKYRTHTEAIPISNNPTNILTKIQTLLLQTKQPGRPLHIGEEIRRLFKALDPETYALIKQWDHEEYNKE